MDNTETKKEEKIVKAKSKKSFFLKFLIFLVLCCLITSVVLFFFLGGYAKRLGCGLVFEDSYLFNLGKCDIASNTDQLNVGDDAQSNNNSTQNLKDEGQVVAGVVAEVDNGIVGISTQEDNLSENSVIGTGFLVSDKGVIVTNRHVVSNENIKYFISFKDQKTLIEVKSDQIFRDPVNDVALIKINGSEIPEGTKVLSIGDSDKIKLGETVIAIGNPLGEFTGSVTKGIISGLQREVSISQGFFSTQSEVYQDVIQTDAAINPGNSGGPLLNINGEVIGINFATIDGASNLSFALPINRIKSRLSELEAFGKFKVPFLGVEYRTRLVYFKDQSLVGAQIINVVEGSPAKNAGIMVGDVVIEFAGEDLSQKQLASLIQTKKIGEQVSIIVVRERLEKEIIVTIGEK